MEGASTGFGGDGEITPIRLRAKMVRFYLPDVLQELREKANCSKRNAEEGVSVISARALGCSFGLPNS